MRLPDNPYRIQPCPQHTMPHRFSVSALTVKQRSPASPFSLSTKPVISVSLVALRSGVGRLISTLIYTPVYPYPYDEVIYSRLLTATDIFQYHEHAIHPRLARSVDAQQRELHSDTVVAGHQLARHPRLVRLQRLLAKVSM